MPRPKSKRIVHEPPLYTGFKPVGARVQTLEVIDLTLDEFEALRLADQMAMSHAEAAEEMEISRSTFTRLIEQARKKLADFITQGKMLSINGGNVHFRNNIIKCQNCGHMFKTNFNQAITECPVCGSDKLLNLAGGFGHGNCCRHRNKNV
ncbi:MAG: DUF134 domain-containing protein [Bacteroidales bacterium]|nr:DUF134 domain-containing protein [Bacteroidales bacterium]